MVVYGRCCGIVDMVSSYLYHFPIFPNSSGELLLFLSPLGLCGMVPTCSFRTNECIHTCGYAMSTGLQPGQRELSPKTFGEIMEKYLLFC